MVRPSSRSTGRSAGWPATSARPDAPGSRREDAGDARISLGDRGRGGGLALRRDDLERSRRAGAERLLQLRVAGPRPGVRPAGP